MNSLSFHRLPHAQVAWPARGYQTYATSSGKGTRIMSVQV